MPQQNSLFPAVGDVQRAAADAQISEKQKETDYDIREYPVEVIVSKFRTELSPGKTELFVPDYQRDLVWLLPQKQRFIESLFLNLPIPYVFVADVGDEAEDADGRLEIVDGSQRIRTLVQFMENVWPLNNLQVLTALNGFYYRDLSQGRRLRFNRKTLRLIELTETSDEEARRMIFDRLNSGGTPLKSMEQRVGARTGPFLDLLSELSEYPQFKALCPVSDARTKRREYLELVLRFFAYSERYEAFDKRVDAFLDEYLDQKNSALTRNPALAQIFQQQFQQMLTFVEKTFPMGFRKSLGNKSVPRIRFEALAVGSSLALAQQPDVVPVDMDWLSSEDFVRLTRSDASNSRPRVIDRITFVRDHLLGHTWVNCAETEDAE